MNPVETLLIDAGTGPLGLWRSRCSFDGALDPHADLGHAFIAAALMGEDLPALTTSHETVRYADLLNSAIDVSCCLQQSRSFRRGAPVLLLLPNSPEYVAAYFGTLMAGGVVVPLPPRVERQQFQSVRESTEAQHVITQLRTVRSRADILSDGPTRTVVPGNPVCLPSVDDATANSLAAVMFTGGSSGTPKGVMLSHRNLLENARSIQQYLQIQSSDRPLCILPFYHAFGNSVLQSHLLAGSHLVLDGNPTFPETIIEAIVKHNVTSLSGVPDLFRFLLERSSLGATALPSLKYMAVAGGSLPHELSLNVAARIAPAKFFVMYGQTEATARLAYVPPDHLPELGASCIGRAVPGVDLEVVNSSGVPVAAGESGEIRARGPNIMLGYWGDPKRTSEVIRDGWLYTGDLGEVDSSGWIYHRGRLNALIKIAGYRIHPSDLENFIIRSFPVQQAVVVPVEQAELGTRLALFVRAQAGTTELNTNQIVAVCRAELPRHMVPDLVQLVEEFPLNDAMKIDRLRLAALAAEATLQKRKIA
ncbi:MAG: acyl--CoA ligase [Planctomycetes bacterium]|nr:acyl--CoA ligase [Planctomycetota bacterium]